MSQRIIAALIDEYVKNPQNINEEQIKIVEDGFDLMKSMFELDVIKFEFMLRTFRDKRKRATEKGIGKMDQVIRDIEEVLKDGTTDILKVDKMKNAFEDTLKNLKDNR